MQATRVNICSGYPLESPKGNSVTAKRLTSLLCEAGLDAKAMHTTTPPEAENLIALHALKTADTTRFFRHKFPEARIHVVLTGTDLYHDINERRELAEHVFETADTLVLAHAHALHTLPKKWHYKAVVIHPGVAMVDPTVITPPPAPLFTVIGHLRSVKNSHLLAKTLKHLPKEQLAAYSIGDALSEEDAAEARFHEHNDPRYRWISGQSRADALGWMKISTATLNTSHLEGGSNAIIEAIHLGCPVIASNIEGNRGLLGDDYSGYFTPNSQEELAALIQKCTTDTTFLTSLKKQLKKRLPLFTPGTECQAWISLLTR